MSYNEIYKNGLGYNDTEKKYIEQIMILLAKLQISQQQKLEFESKLVQIMRDFGELNKNDKYYVEKRHEINQRIYVLFTRLYEMDKSIDYNIETDIVEFDNNAVILTDLLNSTEKELHLNATLDLTREIRKIDVQYKKMVKQFQIIQNKVDEFKEKHGSNDSSMVIVGLRKRIALFQNRIKDIKILQIEQYNISVQAVNKKIAKLKTLKNLSEDELIRINDIEELTVFERSRSFSYRNMSYLKKLNYAKLRETINNVDNINTSEKKENTLIYDDLMYASILTDIDRIKNEFNGKLSMDEVNLLKEEITNTYKKLHSFNIRIKNNTSIDYQKVYLDNITNCQLQLDELNRKCTDTIYNITQSEYRMFKEQIDEIQGNIFNYGNIVESLRGEIKNVVSLDIQKNLDKLNLKLGNIEKEIGEKYKNGRIDDVQYKNLSYVLASSRENMDDVINKLKKPEVINDVNIFDNLSEKIDHFAKVLITLNSDLDKYPDIITDKKKREDIEKVIDILWNDDSNIRKYLELHKDEDKEKYAKLVEKLKIQEEKMDELLKKYHEKCPFLVKNVKSAKTLYKKHSKMSLVLCGVAALALVSVVVGPVIIPTIMRHNMIIGYKIPALRKMSADINKVLGASIGAKVVNYTWVLSNGLPLSVSVASASMLKAIALVGARSAALAAVLILGAKKIISKMNLSNLKDKLLDIYYSSADINEIEENEHNSSRKR